MRTAELSFDRIDTDSTKFLRRLFQEKLFQRADNGFSVADDIEKLHVDFKGINQTDGLNIEDVATLALVVRCFAEEGREVVVTYPKLYRGEPSRIHRFLERLGFRSLFSNRFSTEEWLKKIHFELPRDEMLSLPFKRRTTNYVPLRWFDLDDFVFDDTIPLWRNHFTLKAHVDKQLRDVLLSHGFADPDTIDLLVKTMFLELGSNVVLHSQAEPGAGLGVFCCQVGERELAEKKLVPEITFCLADLGRGIPSALGGIYQNDKKWKDYHKRNKIGEKSGIVRYAIDSCSSSRPDFPSNYDTSGFRGLALVASALQGRGELLIRSDGGAVELKGASQGTRAKTTDRFQQFPLPGTQVVGCLRILPKKLAIASHTQIDVTLPAMSLNLVCGLSGECSALANAPAAEHYAQKISNSTQFVLFDLGYADKSTRSLEYLCKSVIPLNKTKTLIFWNLSTPWTQFSSLNNWLLEQSQKGILPSCIFVRGYNDTRVLGAIENPSDSWLKVILARSNSVQDSMVIGREIFFTSSEFLKVAYEVNSHYLGAGFTHKGENQILVGDANSGFFTGTIHMLRGGRPTSRYFSLTTNISSSADANLRRWSETCAVAVMRLLDKHPVSDSQLVLLGFTGTIREVMARMFDNIQRKCRAFILLTFDIPTKEEISSKVKKGDKVVLITDVILTGTLAESVAGLVAQVGGSVSGIVSLIDGRENDNTAETFIKVGFEQVPLIACGRIETVPQQLDEIAKCQYWVDPVSLVPSANRTWGWSEEVDKKIDKTLSLITAAESSLCGHIVDGARHTSVFIDLQKLLQNQDLPLQEQIDIICDARLKERNWDDFDPSIVLYPSGISRIESISPSTSQRAESEPVTVYRTAVKTYVEKLRRKWKRFFPIEVQRAFDPGGGSRCATTIEVPDSSRGECLDVVVADDGVWRGHTINALIQIARRLGAARILVMPLLARISPAVAQQFELTHSVESTKAGGEVEVCYCFPLLLPIPYYGQQECPFDITIKRIRDRRLAIPFLQDTANQLIQSLEGKTPGESENSPAFNAAWLRFRTYVELASEHEGMLERINSEIESMPSESEEFLAVLRMFSSEWPLLGRARLRQTIRPTLRSRCELIAVDSRARGEIRVAAFTVLRSLFRESFVESLAHVTRNAADDPDLLARLTFQIATLKDPLRRHKECTRFLEEIGGHASVVAALNSDRWATETLRNYYDSVAACNSLSLELRSTNSNDHKTTRSAAIHLYRLLAEDPTFKHHLQTFVEILAGSSKGINDFDAENFRSLNKAWKEQHEPLFVNEILPCLQIVHELLLQAATHGFRILSEDTKYLESGASQPRNAVAALTSGLQFLEKTPDIGFMKTGLVTTCAALLKNVVGKDSTTLQLLKQIKQITVGQMIDSFAQEIKSYFAALPLAVKIQKEGKGDANLSAHIFAPPQLISQCTGNILDNLIRYAFSTNRSDSQGISPMIAISAEQYWSENNEPMIRISIRNNGNLLRQDAVMGNGGRRVQAALKRFGGEYSLPFRETQMPWTVTHRVTFLLW